MIKLKTLIASSVLGLSLVSASSFAENCNMVPDLNVEFKNDSTAYMNNDERNEVVEFATFIKAHDLYTVVEGHTSYQASARHNYDLSSRRAVKIRSELIRLGVKPDQVSAIGFGESSPLYDNQIEIGAEKNRRVSADVFNSKSELAEYVASEKNRVSKIKFTEQ